MASSRVLMRMLAAAFLLLLGNATDGRARSAHSHRDSRIAIASASQSALLAASPIDTKVGAALPPLLASAESLPDARVESAPAPIRVASSLRSCERTTVHAARPPPFQA